MAAEFFSGGVCQKENGENCSAEAVKDGRWTKVKGNFVFIVVCVTGVGNRILSLKPRAYACMSA